MLSLILSYLNFQKTDENWYNFLELLELSTVEKYFHIISYIAGTVKQHISNNTWPFLGSQPPSKNCHTPSNCFSSKVKPLTLRISEQLRKILINNSKSQSHPFLLLIIVLVAAMTDTVPKHHPPYKSVRPALFEGCKWRRLINWMKST